MCQTSREVKVMSWPFLTVKTLGFGPRSQEICVPLPFLTGLQLCAPMEQSMKFRETEMKTTGSTVANENTADVDRLTDFRETNLRYLRILLF